MGALEIHFREADRALIEKAQRGEILTPDEEERLSLLSAYAALNAKLSERPDEQKSHDGYGVEDGAKQ